MRLLLDTNALIWLAIDERHLSRRATLALEDPQNTLSLSSVVGAELAIKSQLARFGFPRDIRAFVEEATAKFGLVELPFTLQHAEALGSLPRHHGDPFDRMLIAQAMVEGLAIVTSDRIFPRYPVDIVW